MKKTFTKLLLLCGLLCVLASAAIAQKVKGVVVSADDKLPIIGAAVKVLNGEASTITDANGNFTIKVDQGQSLVATFIGYEEATVEVGASNFVSITLKGKVKETGQVNIAYGKVARRELTGSVAVVTSKAFENVPTPVFDQALQGKVAGLQVTQSAGVPGAASRIRLRGAGTIDGSGDPLIVVDGMILAQGSNGNNDISSRSNSPYQATNYSTLSAIDQNDIENVSVLKDAAATAIYGARGANGVILITTKSGKNGKAKYRFGYYSGVNSPTKKLSFLSGQEWMSLYNEAKVNDGKAPLGPNEEFNTNGIILTPNQVKGNNTNWVDEMLSNGRVQEASLSVSGGNENTTYLLGGTVNTNEGILKGSQYNRFSIRANIQNKATNFLNLSSQTQMSYVTNKAIGTSFNAGSFGSAQSNSLAIYPIYNKDGSFFGASKDQNYNTSINPVAYRQNDIRNWQTRVLQNLVAKVTYTKWLSSSHSLQADVTNLQESFYYSPAVRFAVAGTTAPKGTVVGSGIPLGARTVRSAWNIGTLTTNTLNFDFNIKEKHVIKALAGYEYSYYLQRDVYTGINGGDNFDHNRGSVGFLDSRQNVKMENMAWAANADTFQSRYNSTTNGGNSYVPYAFQSLFTRINYTYSGKYIAELSIRRDGSSNFGPSKRFGYFPAASAAWIISDESFWANAVPFMSFAKVRASYGIQGNPGFASSQWNASYKNGGTYLGQPVLQPSRLYNPDLSWSRAYQTDLSLEYGFLNNRITGTLTYYNRLSTNVLINRAVQQSANGIINSIYVNDPDIEIRDRGVEFSISASPLTGEFRWQTDFNISRNVNTVLKLGSLGFDAINAGPGDARIIEGYTQGISYLAEYVGVNKETGMEMIRMLNGRDTVATADNVRNNRKPMGNPQPKFFGGWSNSFNYKGFDFTMNFVFSYGNTVYDDAAKRQWGGYLANWNQRSEILRRWQKPGDETDIPKVSLNTSYGDWNNTSRWLYDASYIRLRNVTLGYNVPQAWLQNYKVTSIRFYVSAMNILTFTKYKGWDPEVTRTVEDPKVSNVSSTAPYLPTPQMKTITCGFNIGF